MKKFLFATLLFSSSLCAFAQQQKALIIGIDKYAPPAGTAPASGSRINFPNLDGCKNDALAIKDAVIARYGFRQNDIKELYNSDATRDNILAGMNDLLGKCKSGDIAFIFYAGHGSQVKNSLSTEPGQLDQSMVPANTWKAGVGDIRDKELGAIFNKFVDKGVVLTVIYDCCHSANMSRGISDMPKLRYIESPDYDAKDGSNPEDPAKKSGSHFLMISACQSYQFASEAHDENNKPHGAFTIALLNAMKQLSVNATAMDIFNDARAILKCDGKSQEPAITGSTERLNGTLFGIGKGVLSDKVLVPVMGIDDGVVKLQGGLISGLDSGVTLKNAEGTVTLTVTEMDGADQCNAVVTAGDVSNVKAGALFQVTNWVSDKKSFLKIYIPSSSLSFDKVSAIAAECEKLKKNSAVKWVYDLDKQDPTVTLYYRDGAWHANTDKGQVNVTSFSADNIARQFKGAAIFVNLPPTKELLDSINSSLKDQANVKITTNPAEANYAIIGRSNTNVGLEYALYNSGAATKDSLGTMPTRTEYEKLTKTSTSEVAAKLTDYAFKLGKIRVWFTLSNPAGTQGFPFSLEIRDKTTGKKIDSEVNIHQYVSFYIVRDTSNKSNLWDNSFRYVYVFLIDHNGEMKLVFPKMENGNDQNHFPDRTKPNGDNYFVGTFRVGGPTGTDNYYLFSSSEPILTYKEVFNQPGVMTGDTRGIGGGLSDLLNLGNISTRGLDASAPNNWAIKKLSVKTVYRMTP